VSAFEAYASSVTVEDLDRDPYPVYARLRAEAPVCLVPAVGLWFVTSWEDVEWAATSRHRFRAVMVTVFATLAVVLAMVGVFGILAYSVQQRMRDFGVRRALGATTQDVVRLVAGDAARVVAVGAAMGIGLSLLLSRLLGSMLFGVAPWDPATFAAVTLVLVLTATLSIAGPAWRATRIDPARALRGE